jgi:WD40-like Beta Propeller Repeat
MVVQRLAARREKELISGVRLRVVATAALITLILIAPDATGGNAFIRLSRNATVAYESDDQNDTANIWVMKLDGSARRRLTFHEKGQGAEFPAWSPSGRQIAFMSDRVGLYDIYVMNADGSAQRRLTTNRRSDEFPAWSPDGKKIAFASSRRSLLSPAPSISRFAAAKALLKTRSYRRGQGHSSVSRLTTAWSSRIIVWMSGHRTAMRTGVLLIGVGFVTLAALSSVGMAQNVGRVIFRDNFSKRKGGWITGSNRHEAVGYSHGSLFIEMKRAGEGYSALATAAPQASNMTVSVTAKNITGHSGTRFGVDCRSNRSSTPPYRDLGYTFSIYNDGSFGIERSQAQSVKVLARGQSAKIAHAHRSYDVAARCVGTRLTLLVDGKAIATVSDSTYTRGRYGVFVWADGSSLVPATVRFSNFIVRSTK